MKKIVMMVLVVFECSFSEEIELSSDFGPIDMTEFQYFKDKDAVKELEKSFEQQKNVPLTDSILDYNYSMFLKSMGM